MNRLLGILIVCFAITLSGCSGLNNESNSTNQVSPTQTNNTQNNNKTISFSNNESSKYFSGVKKKIEVTILNSTTTQEAKGMKSDVGFNIYIFDDFDYAPLTKNSIKLTHKADSRSYLTIEKSEDSSQVTLEKKSTEQLENLGYTNVSPIAVETLNEEVPGIQYRFVQLDADKEGDFATSFSKKIGKDVYVVTAVLPKSSLEKVNADDFIGKGWASVNSIEKK